MINLTHEQLTAFVECMADAKRAEVGALEALAAMLRSPAEPVPAATAEPAPPAQQPAAEPAAPPPPPAEQPAQQPAQQTAPPAQQPAAQLSFEQFNATVLNQINGPAGAILKAPGPDGVPPIRALMLRYTDGKGGAGNIPQEQYGNFLRELTALAAAGGGAA